MAQPTRFGGAQDGLFETGDYQITESIVVHRNKRLTFSEGCRVFVDQFCGMKIYGELICEGTKDRPIIITTSRLLTDSLNSKSHIKWNGIEVLEQGKIGFRHVLIQNSIIGITVPDSNAFSYFDSVRFSRNDNSLSILDKSFFIPDGEPFTISLSKDTSKLIPNVIVVPQADHVGKSRSPVVPIIRYVCGALALGSIYAWSYYAEASAHYDTKYNLSHSASTELYKAKRDDYYRYSRVGMVGTLITVPICVFTWTIGNDFFTKGR
jgi:hypothetical protein